MILSMMKSISNTWIHVSSRIESWKFSNFFCETTTKSVLRIAAAKFLFRIFGIQIIKKFGSIWRRTMSFVRTFHPSGGIVCLAHRWNHLKKGKIFRWLGKSFFSGSIAVKSIFKLVSRENEFDSIAMVWSVPGRQQKVIIERFSQFRQTILKSWNVFRTYNYDKIAIKISDII